MTPVDAARCAWHPKRKGDGNLCAEKRPVPITVGGKPIRELFAQQLVHVGVQP